MPRKGKQSAHLSAARQVKESFSSDISQPRSSENDADLDLEPPSTPARSRSRSRSPQRNTASKRKLKYYRSRSRSTPERTNRCSRTIVELSTILSLISRLRCSQQGCLSQVEGLINWRKSRGFAVCIEVYCPLCNKAVEEMYTSTTDETSHACPKPFLINKLVTMSSVKTDMGPYKLANFCEVLDMPSLHPTTFVKKAKQLYSHSDELREEIFTKSMKTVRQEYSKETGTVPNPETTLDIAVSFDGTWMTRGHSSLVGMGCVIDTVTGLVLDSHVLCQHCQTCATTGEWIRTTNPNPQGYINWLERHKAQDGCPVNHQGSSAMMEAAAAEIIWARSLALHNVRYTTLVGDGDSKAFDRVRQLQPYEADIQIDKEECMNHVAKRMGTGLRNIVQTCRTKGITLGGHRQGSLTEKAIRKLGIYYGRAIRGNDNVEDMRKAIWASLYHCYSTDDNPQHQFCPSGDTSWCFFKSAIAIQKFPGDHANHIHTKLDQKRLHEHLQPLYDRLTHTDLLQRCLRHKTQNTNESLHSKIWSMCNKLQCHSYERVVFSSLSAIAEFNFGPMYTSELEQKLYNLDPGYSTNRLRCAKENKRLQKSEDVAKGKEKARKVKQTEAIRQREADTIRDHGDVGYGSGKY